MADEVIKAELSDHRMKEVFDRSDSDIPIRDTLWDYFTEKNGRDTMKTEGDIPSFLKDFDDKIKAFVNENLKK